MISQLDLAVAILRIPDKGKSSVAGVSLALQMTLATFSSNSLSKTSRVFLLSGAFWHHHLMNTELALPGAGESSSQLLSPQLTPIPGVLTGNPECMILLTCFRRSFASSAERAFVSGPSFWQVLADNPTMPRRIGTLIRCSVSAFPNTLERK